MIRGMIATALLWAVVVSHVRAKALKIGDAAPELAVREFFVGEPVARFDKGKVYVVAFWSTWGDSCRAIIPHLTELQKRHSDVVFLAVSVFELTPEKVQPFVEERGAKITFRTAADATPDAKAPRDGAMARSWMSAAELDDIPSAFIVNGDGKIAWIGDPKAMSGPLEKITSGRWDLKAAATAFAASRRDRAQRLNAEMPKAERTAVWAVEKLGGKIVRDAERQSTVFVDLGRTRATDSTLRDLQGLKGIQELGLADCTRLTDSGLHELSRLNGLQTLVLTGCDLLTNAGLKELQQLNGLRTLVLAGCDQITDAGLSELWRLPKLETLVLAGCDQITDAGLKEIRRLGKLRELDLTGAWVTDAGLTELNQMKGLRTLTLFGTYVTDVGVANLEKALPELRIER